MSDAVRVLIADDDDLMRAGLRAVLSSDPEIELVGEAADGRAAIDQVRALSPDVVLMDVRMPGLDGIAATRELTATAPAAKVLMLRRPRRRRRRLPPQAHVSGGADRRHPHGRRRRLAALAVGDETGDHGDGEGASAR
jgi:chemotaxis response regulator CheB